MASARTAKPDRPAAPLEQERPNVVMVVIDDMRTSDWKALEKTRRALSGGPMFPNFILNAPLCSPSRASLMTGQYAHNHGVLWNEGDPADTGGFPAYKQHGLDRQSIAFLLQRAGYRTGMIGKFMNGYTPESRQPLGWDRWVAAWQYLYTDYSLVIDGVETEANRGDYLTDVLAFQASRFIESTPETQPLFLYLASTAPHNAPITGTPVPAPRHASAFPGAKAERSPAFNEADVSDKPSYVSSLPSLTPAAIAEADRFERARLQSLLSVDEAIVRVVDSLRQTGRLGNTSIFVMSDNGFLLGEHRLSNLKARPYDGAVRVPMLAWGREFRRKTDDRLVANIDIAPTIAELAGLNMERADGIPLQSKDKRSYVEIDLCPDDAFDFKGRGLRSKDLMYFEYANGEREFYDLRVDPFELNNLWPTGAPAPAAPTGLAGPLQLSASLARISNCKGSNCR
ncbi:MAG: sulfatase family protein [Thermomicrobiales bacterium]